VLRREDAEAMDASDPLARWLDEVAIDDGPDRVGGGAGADVRDGDPRRQLDAAGAHPRRIYFDGNSLGRLPTRTVARLRHTVDDEWGRGLVESWDRWIELPTGIGDRLARSLLGAQPGEVVIADSTTVNLYKLASAAWPDHPRASVLTDRDNFPTDRYVLEALASQRGGSVRWLDTDPTRGPTAEGVAAACATAARAGRPVGLVALSHVGYRTGALADLTAITAAAHHAGARVVWDLSHSVGAVPIALEAAGVDLAVGCTYKHLKGGPGAPAFLYVRRALQEELARRQPIWGWFGQRDQFAMGPEYAPAAGITAWLSGTPPILALAALDEGVRLLEEIGIDAVRARSVALTELLIGLADERLAPAGFAVASPREPGQRGAHVALRHPEAWRCTQALRDRHRLVVDFRPEDLIRLGPDPLSNRFVDVYDAIERVGTVAERREWEAYSPARGRVT
jgi:kynureninase